MIVEDLKKLKGSKYSIAVEGKSYTLDEEVILEYRLVKGREIDSEILFEAAKKNELMEYYHKAIDYTLRYGKSEGAVYDYLINKGLTEPEAEDVIRLLNEHKILNDQALIEGQISALVRKKYGRLYIKEKLISRRFKPELIASAMENIDTLEYVNALNELYLEALKRYKGDDYISKAKAKKYLLSRGYSFDDLNRII